MRTLEVCVSDTRERYLTRVQLEQDPETKRCIAEGHLSAIQRELQRTGSWRAGLRLLDVGCGQGLYSRAFAAQGFDVVGVDAYADLITLANQRPPADGQAITYQVARCEHLPHDDKEFDVVFANSLIEHVDDWRSAIDEWIRVLSPDGLLWIETTNVLHPRQREFRWLPLYSWWPRPLKHVAVRMAKGPCPALANYIDCPAVHWFSYWQLREYLSNRGLEVRDRFDVMDPTQTGRVKNVVRKLALSSNLGRTLAYTLVGTVIVMGRKSRIPGELDRPT